MARGVDAEVILFQVRGKVLAFVPTAGLYYHNYVCRMVFLFLTYAPTQATLVILFMRIHTVVPRAKTSTIVGGADVVGFDSRRPFLRIVVLPLTVDVVVAATCNWRKE